jgi:hypothetical protein
MKPIVFFSHSSLDSDRVKPIKERILLKTGNAIEIFMPSDGASIPFGKNWLKEIEEALVNCKLMFVWVTPNSTRSYWIYFESGYAYSRNIKVVPIGFDGIKLEEIPAPLSILQGFNVTSSASLDNIMAVINREFQLTFPDIFDDAFFHEHIIKYSTENSSELLEYVTGIECELHPRIKVRDDEDVNIRDNWFELFQSVLREKEETFTLMRNGEFYGVGFKIYPRPDGGSHPKILIDPLALNKFWEILAELNRVAYDDGFKRLILKINLNPDLKLPSDHYLISSRLENTEVDFNTDMPHVIYRFRNIQFRINISEESVGGRLSARRELIVLVDQDNKELIPLVSLIKLLARQRIISE